jgi:hypothetical protein
MKRVISLFVIFVTVIISMAAAMLAGCSAGLPANTPPAAPANSGGNYTPNPNNVHFNDGSLTTNFITDNPYNDGTKNSSLLGS